MYLLCVVGSPRLAGEPTCSIWYIAAMRQGIDSTHMGAYVPVDLADRFNLAARIDGRKSNSEALRVAMLAYVETIESRMEKRPKVRKLKRARV